MKRYKRSASVLFGTLAVYALLVSTNLGEFWPFSIYPMFSQGGIAWSRAVVREVPSDAIQWAPVSLSELPGDAYALSDHGIDHVDLANFVSKTQVWSEERVAGLRKMFGQAALDRHNLLVMRAQGRITESDSVVLSFVPYVLLAADRSELNDQLKRSVTD